MLYKLATWPLIVNQAHGVRLSESKVRNKNLDFRRENKPLLKNLCNQVWHKLYLVFARHYKNDKLNNDESCGGFMKHVEKLFQETWTRGKTWVRQVIWGQKIPRFNKNECCLNIVFIFFWYSWRLVACPWVGLHNNKQNVFRTDLIYVYYWVFFKFHNGIHDKVGKFLNNWNV